MAVCARCHRPITSAQSRSAVEVRDENGKLKGAKHGKCARLDDRSGRLDEQAAAGNPRAGHGAPSAYEAAAQFGDDRRVDAEYALARAASAKLADERTADLDERRHDNWRQETTADLDDLVEGTGEVLTLDDL